MNIFKSLFGIFRKGGLVEDINDGKSLSGFALAALSTAIIGSLLYGFSMGIGIGLDTAIKDAIKISLITLMVLIFSIPVFWIAFRLFGREESMGHVNAVPLTMLATVTLILAITSPIVFLLSVLINSTSNAIYIHIIIINLAILVGLYITGTLIFHTFEDHKRLVTPAIISISMMGVILIVGMMFFSPFLSPSSKFSEGTALLRDGLGIGVDIKAIHSLNAAADAENLSYYYLKTNDNGDIVQDYVITKIGDNYLIDINVHTVTGETEQHNKKIWVLDEEIYSDFNDNSVDYAVAKDVIEYLSAAMPSKIFAMPSIFEVATWRGRQNSDKYSAIATTQDLEKATIIMDKDGRLLSFNLGSAANAIHSMIEISNISSANITQIELENSLRDAKLKSTFINVKNRVDQSIHLVKLENQLTYQINTYFANGELIQDYSVTRIGENFRIQVHLHALPGEILREDQNIWVINGIIYHDFNDGKIAIAKENEISSYLKSSLPSNIFTLSAEFENAIWKSSQNRDTYSAIGKVEEFSTINIRMDVVSTRLLDFSIDYMQPSTPASILIKNIEPTKLDLAALQSSLNEAVIIGQANDAVPSMNDYVNSELLFLLRIPETWSSIPWNSNTQSIQFFQNCMTSQNCTNLNLTVNNINENNSVLEYAEILGANLRLQPEYRKINVNTVMINESEVGIVNYLFDEVENGNLISTQHNIFLYKGLDYQYQLDFSVLNDDFKNQIDLFEKIADLFIYLKPLE